MQKKFSFDSFLKAHGDEFHSYLGEKVYEGEDDVNYRELSHRLEEVYEKNPKLSRIVRFQEVHSLTQSECEALIEVHEIVNRMASLEWETIYFQGCGDCVTYLKQMKLL